MSLGGSFRGDTMCGFGFMSSMDDWMSVIRLSKLVVLDGFRPDRDARDLGGLVRELAWLVWLAWLGRRWGWLPLSELLDDVDSEDAWYGFPIPNSSARLIVGTPGVVGRTTPVRGGGGRDISGPPLLGLLDLSLVIGTCPSGPPGEFGWSRCWSGRSVADRGGAEGVRTGGAKRSLGRGKVSDLFGVAGGSSAPSGALDGGPKPPYPFCLCGFGALPLPRPLLMFEADVPGRSFTSGPAADGRRPKGPDMLFTVFIRSIRFGPCFLGGFA
jgi:hypothetical protein